MVVPFPARPGPSPVLAACWAAGILEPRHRILDLGCGTGSDALDLARWGARDVTGVDRNRQALGVARARATKARLGKRVRFVHADVADLPWALNRAQFDRVLDSLLLNNLRDERPYAEAVAAVMPPGAVLVIQLRVTRRAFEDPRPERFPELAKYFRLGPEARALVPDVAGMASPFARVNVRFGVRNHRPSRG